MFSSDRVEYPVHRLLEYSRLPEIQLAIKTHEKPDTAKQRFINVYMTVCTRKKIESVVKTVNLNLCCVTHPCTFHEEGPSETSVLWLLYLTTLFRYVHHLNVY